MVGGEFMLIAMLFAGIGCFVLLRVFVEACERL